MKRQYRKGLNIPMILACILFCLTLFSFHFMGGLYAKYTAHTSASDKARVAKFEITDDNKSFTKDFVISFAPGTIETEIQVVNKSETAVAYTITIENLTQNIPLQFQIADSTEMFEPAPQTYDLSIGQTDKYTVKLIWSHEDALQHMGKVDQVRIVLNAVQID